MPKISPIYNQHRQAIGNHTMRLDRKQGGQELQNERVKKTAMQPGRHKKTLTDRMLHMQLCSYSPSSVQCGIAI